MANQLCQCGSKLSEGICCIPFINGDMIPDTPEKLMRSRYTAYTYANIPYIINTMAERALINFDQDDAFQWAKSVKWLKLEVIRSKIFDDNIAGLVEFKAYYRYRNKKHYLHEVSEFKLTNDRWVYVGMLQ